MQTVPVYEWLLNDEPMGLGTQVEFDYWSAEGTLDGYVLGEVIGYEPASEDAERQAHWGTS